MSDIDYYEDESQWGNYQYETLETIINDFMMSQHPDDYSASTPRHKVLYFARQGIKELYFDVLQEFKAIELELSPQLSVTLPPDYVNYVRISWVDEAGMLHPMAANNTMSIAEAYLQDHQYNLLYDDDGCVLKGTGVRDRRDQSDVETSAHRYTICGTSTSFRPNVNRANHYPNGFYRVDKDNGVIEFGADVKGKNIVLEYISDGLWKNCECDSEAHVRVHKFAKSAVVDYISYMLLKNRRNVPAVEKQRARKEYYNSRRIAARRINTMRKTELLQAFKGSTRYIKS